jgi:ABC-type antimicrobial peptide transport system permease subunit
LNILQNAGIDALAKDGAMYHIFSSAVGEDGGSGQITVSELNSIINDNTQLTQYTEFVYSSDLISGFMLILQNAFSALLLAFVIVLLVVAVVSLSHSISAEIEADTKNVGILKTVGLTSGRLQKIQLLQYLTAIVPAMILGLILAYLLARLISSATITTIGVRIPAKLPLFECVLSFAFILLWFVGFITACSWKVNRITPMTAICTGTENIRFNTKKMISAFGKVIYLRLAIRQLVTGKKRYIGSLAVAVILVFFASLVGRMNSWLGSDGKGMMDAFNPADHDIGVQVFGNLTEDEAEKIILSYTDITDTYLLAMPGVAVNGIDYTANVISEPERFHIIEGRTCFADNEIVLTEFVAANFGVSIGDIVTVRGDIGSGEYIVSGIYSCANDMGDNVGMSREGYLKIGSDNPHIWCHHYFLADTSKKTAVTQNLEALYGGDVHVHENTWPGLFGIIAAMHALIAFMYGMVIAFILIVTAMTGSKVLSAEQKALGIYKAIGFKTKNLRLTFALRFGLVAVLGSIIGTCLATALTDSLVSAVMKLAGISNFYSSPAPGEIILPSVIVTALFFCFAYMAAGKIKKVNLTELIAEM